MKKKSASKKDGQNFLMNICETNEIHPENIIHAKEKMPEESLLYDLAEFFKTFGDSTRVRIVAALIGGEMCVCDLASVLNMSVSAVSHQLRILRAAKIVRPKRQGKQIFYSIEDHHVGILYSVALEHIREESSKES